MSLTAIVFVLVYCAALIASFALSPMFGFGAYLWAFYNHPQSRWWGEALPEVRWSYIASIVTFISLWGKPYDTSRPSWLRYPPAWLLLIYTLWMWAQSLFAVDSVGHAEGCFLFTKYLMLYFVMYRLAENDTALRQIAWGHILGCFIFGWIAFRTDVQGRLDAVGGPGVDDANVLAMHLITGLAMAGFLLLREKAGWRAILFLLLPFILNGVIETQSRGALVAIAVAAPVGLYLCPRGHRFVTYSIVGLGAILFLMLANEALWNRAKTIQLAEESAMEGSAASRIALIRYGWAIFKDHPLGTGHKGHEALSRNYIPAAMLSNAGTRAAHNTFMQILVEQGIVGAVLYVILLLWVVRQLWILKRMDKQGLPSELGLYRAGIGSALAGAFIAEIFLGSLKAEVNIWLLALLAAFSAVCKKSLEEQREVTVPLAGTDSVVPSEERPNRFALVLHSEFHRR